MTHRTILVPFKNQTSVVQHATSCCTDWAIPAHGEVSYLQRRFLFNFYHPEDVKQASPWVLTLSPQWSIRRIGRVQGQTACGEKKERAACFEGSYQNRDSSTGCMARTWCRGAYPRSIDSPSPASKPQQQGNSQLLLTVVSHTPFIIILCFLDIRQNPFSCLLFVSHPNNSRRSSQTWRLFRD
jgi:hypothetical protein